MSADTTAINRQRNHFPDRDSVWVFGYGSLLYKVDFPWLERRAARISHWQRRFWQGSHDHRGTPQAPGRVLTLVEAPGAICAGMAYRVTPAVFEHLDYREKNGYLRFATTIHFDDDSSDQALVYIATPDNPAWLGPAGERDIAAHIARSQGPSGHNRDYALRLAQALRELAAEDEHVFAIERELLSGLPA